MLLILFFQTCVANGGGLKTPSGISRLLDEIETQFQRLPPPPISMTAIPMEVPAELADATGSGKSKMAASKLQIRRSQLVHKIPMEFQWLYPCFGVQLSNENNGNVVQSNWKKPEVESPRRRPQTSNTYITACTQDSNKIPTA